MILSHHFRQTQQLNSDMNGAFALNQSIDISGIWSVQLPDTEGQLFWDAEQDSQRITLPGSLTSNGIGDPISVDTPWMGMVTDDWANLERYEPYRQPDNIKVPFWLQPDKYYCGPAWYRREVEIPESWRGKRIVFSFERCHWKTTLWLDDLELGSCDSLSVPHRYEVRQAVEPGRHVLTLCIDNRYHIRIGTNSSAITDHSQTNWNGVVGEMSMNACEPVRLSDVQAFPNVSGKCCRFKATIVNDDREECSGQLLVSIVGNGNENQVQLEPVKIDVKGGKGEHVMEWEQHMGDDLMLWNEFNPNLYEARLALKVRAGKAHYEVETALTFGMCEIKTEGRKILINHVPTILRGTVDCATFPLTGYPSTDVTEWLRIMNVVKAYGLNHIRFHSWCPPEAAFIAADRLGVYLQVEGPVWRGSCEHKEAAPVEPYLIKECKRILKEYANHPSFVLFVQGNEPWELDREWLNGTWIPEMRAFDPRPLLCAGAHYPLVSQNDFHLPGDYEGFSYRYQNKFYVRPGTTLDYEDQIAKKNVPCIAHETGQWCVFPNLKEIRKYTGCLKAHNLEIVRDFLEKNHMLDLAEDFLWTSGRFQTEIYKECTEALLRTRGTGGFQMLGLNDFPGQGTALIGAVDVFWEDKGYTDASEYRRFSGSVVPLAIMEKRVWEEGETFEAGIRLSQYLDHDLTECEVYWEITNGYQCVGHGKYAARSYPVGNDNDIGHVELYLDKMDLARRLKLKISLPSIGIENSWNFWVFPSQPLSLDKELGDVVLASNRSEALKHLAQGRKVLLAPGPNGFDCDTEGTFAPIFWNKPWFPGQSEHTTGLLIQKNHPIFKNFPTDVHADWQWWEIMNQSRPMVMDDLQPEFRSMIHPIDDWNTCRRLGLAIEAKVGPGSLFLTSIDLRADLTDKPSLRQLIRGVVTYLNSEEFDPVYAMNEVALEKITPDNPMYGLVPEISACSSKHGCPSQNLLDLRPSTIWHSRPRGEPKGYPHEIILDFGKPIEVKGFNILPRQDGRDEGLVKTIEIYGKADGDVWGEVLIRMDLPNNQEWKRILFDKTSLCKSFRILCLAPQKEGDQWASFSRLTPIRSDQK